MAVCPRSYPGIATTEMSLGAQRVEARSAAPFMSPHYSNLIVSEVLVMGQSSHLSTLVLPVTLRWHFWGRRVPILSTYRKWPLFFGSRQCSGGELTFEWYDLEILSGVYTHPHSPVEFRFVHTVLLLRSVEPILVCFLLARFLQRNFIPFLVSLTTVSSHICATDALRYTRAAKIPSYKSANQEQQAFTPNQQRNNNGVTKTDHLCSP
ncbi:hypothetical protein K439DRAFT_1665397 [Ramaria rubella]|nr:hypothetical protein K439DRAFT_1665397 [Ramaria rubella]